MFGLFKCDPRKDLEKRYRQKLEEAMQRQRNGDIAGYSQLSAEAAEIDKKLQDFDRTA